MQKSSREQATAISRWERVAKIGEVMSIKTIIFGLLLVLVTLMFVMMVGAVIMDEEDGEEGDSD